MHLCLDAHLHYSVKRIFLVENKYDLSKSYNAIQFKTFCTSQFCFVFSVSEQFDTLLNNNIWFLLILIMVYWTSEVQLH